MPPKAKELHTGAKRVNSRAKGCRGELEFAKLLTAEGYPARRGQQYAGGGDSPDVVSDGLAGLVHFEVKLTERALPYPWIEQASRDAKPGEARVVVHRQSRKEWLAMMPVEDFFTLLKRAYPDARRSENAGSQE